MHALMKKILEGVQELKQALDHLHVDDIDSKFNDHEDRLDEIEESMSGKINPLMHKEGVKKMIEEMLRLLKGKVDKFEDDLEYFRSVQKDDGEEIRKLKKAKEDNEEWITNLSKKISEFGTDLGKLKNSIEYSHKRLRELGDKIGNLEGFEYKGPMGLRQEFEERMDHYYERTLENKKNWEILNEKLERIEKKINE